MPVTPAGVAGLVAPSLAAAGMVGTDAPRIAAGIGVGVSTWVASISVVTADVGTAGVGSGGPIPVVIPGTLLGNMQTGFGSAGLAGMFSPGFSAGLASGLTQAFLQGLVKTAHAGVGSGSGVAKFVAPPATGPIAAGLTSAGIAGIFQAQLSAAVGLALDLTFATLVLPIPIVGTASPTAASGTGFGKIV